MVDGRGGKNSCALGHGFVKFVAPIVFELARELIDSEVWNAEEFDVLLVDSDGYGVDNPSWCGNVYGGLVSMFEDEAGTAACIEPESNPPNAFEVPDSPYWEEEL